MAVLEKQPSETLAFLYVFSSKNDFFNTLLMRCASILTDCEPPGV